MDVGYFEFLFQNCLALNMMCDAGCSHKLPAELPEVGKWSGKKFFKVRESR